MFVRLRRGDSSQTFSVWVVGKSGDLHRGAGIPVRQEGSALDHHFLLPRDGTSYQFLAGTYELDLFAVVVGRTRPQRLTSVELTVTESQAAALRDTKGTGLYFDWSPETGRYHGHVDNARPRDPLPFFLMSPEPPNPNALPPASEEDPETSSKPT
jgi:hypothetical protein